MNLNVFLSKELMATTDVADLESMLTAAITDVHNGKVGVHVSKVLSNKPVSLTFEGFVVEDDEELEGFGIIQTIVDRVVDKIAFYFGDAIDGKNISISIKSTVLQEVTVELP